MKSNEICCHSDESEKKNTSYGRCQSLLDLEVIKKKRSRHVYLAVQADHRIKTKEGEKRDKYLDRAKKMKKSGTWMWWW